MLKKIGVFLLISIITIHFGCIGHVTSHFNYRGKSKAFKEYDVYVDSFYIDPDFKEMNIKRVLFLPLSSKVKDVANIGSKVSSICITEFQKKGFFEIVFDENLENKVKFNYASGQISKQDIMQLGKDYNVDAVIYGAVLQYRPYVPFVLGISLNMARVWDGKTVWSAQDVKDASLKETKELAKHYFYKFISDSHPLTEWKVLFMSQDRYIRFVSYLFVDTFEFRKKMRNTKKKKFFR